MCILFNQSNDYFQGRLMKNFSFAILASLTVTACSSFDIYDNNGESVKGIPYYVKKGAVKQTTAYSRSWLEVTIEYSKIKADGKALTGSKNSAKFDIKMGSYDSIELLSAFAEAQKQVDSGFATALGIFKTELDKGCSTSAINCSISPSDKSDDLSSKTRTPLNVHQEFISNKAAYESIVDYSKVYYFNTIVPPFGTTTGSVTLAADGTLTTGTSTVDTTKLAEVIPLNEILLKKFKLGDYLPALTNTNKSNTKPKSPIPIPILTISISKKSYQYNLTKHLPYNSGLNLVPLDFNSSNISIAVVTSNSSSSKPAENTNAIKLNGTIELPKPK